MATARLTARGVDALQTEKVQEDVWDELVPGLALRVTKSGTKTWAVRYRAGAGYRRLTLGRFPVLTLADARARAKEELAKVAAGEDPAQERRALRSGDATFRALAEEVLEAKAARTRPATRRERRRILDRELLPAWGSRPAGSITRRDVLHLVEGIARRGAPVMANRTAALVKMLYNEVLNREFLGVEYNPAARVKARDEGTRERYLDRAEIRAVWRATEPESPVTRAAFRLALLTAQRIGSVLALRWVDVDDRDVWTIPERVFKGRRPHAVPLSTEARAVLEGLGPLTGSGDYAFPGRGDGRRPHMTGYNAALRRIRKRAGIPPWTTHDARTTFRTHATRAASTADPRDPAGLGVAPHVADAVLGHKDPSLGVTRYTGDKLAYLLPEKREALEAWGRFVRGAVGED